MIDAGTLRALLDYDPVMGVLRWRATVSSRAVVGSVAGTMRKNQYVQVRINGRCYLAHRLIWLHVYGVWPNGQIDHINGNRADNRASNLREATRAENMMNAKKRINTGSSLKGVTLRNGRYKARIYVNRKEKHLGYFATEQEAHDAYCAAATKEFGAFHRAG